MGYFVGVFTGFGGALILTGNSILGLTFIGIAVVLTLIEFRKG